MWVRRADGADPQAATTSCAILAIDWSFFFDSLERNIGEELTKAMLAQGSTDWAFGYMDAEAGLNRDAKYRYKIGKAVECKSSIRLNGFPQGPSSSISKALAFMSV